MLDVSVGLSRKFRSHVCNVNMVPSMVLALPIAVPPLWLQVLVLFLVPTHVVLVVILVTMLLVVIVLDRVRFH